MLDFFAYLPDRPSNLTLLQQFDVQGVLPSAFSVGAGVVSSALLRGPKGPFVRYGILGELVRAGGIAVFFVVCL